MTAPFLKIDDKIELRFPEDRYTEALFDIIDHQREYLGQWLAWVIHTLSSSDTRAHIKEAMLFNEGGQRLSTFVFYNNTLAGTLGFVRINKLHHNAEIGYWLRQELQGKGIITKACKGLIDHAFTNFNFNRLTIEICSGNITSIAVPERLGFTHEGTLRAALFHNKAYHDVELYSLLKKDWLAQKKV